MQTATTLRRTVSVLAVLLGILALGSTAVAGPYGLNRDSIPDKYKWDFSDIYADWDAWEAGMAELRTLMDQYAGLEGTLGQGPDQLLKAYRLGDKLGMLLYKVYRYPQLMRDTDTRNNEVSARLQEVQILYAEFNSKTSWFNPELLSIPWDTMKGWLDKSPELAPYRFGIENLYRSQEHVLESDEELLLSRFSRLNSAPGSIYDELSTSDIEYPEITLSSGETVKVTPGNYYHILSTNRNQADRRKAFEAHYRVYHENVNTYAAIYNGVLQRDWALAQARNYNSTLEAALFGDNVPTEVFETLLTTVKEGTAPVRRYINLRKEKLGLETYHLYDGSIPIVDIDKTYQYDDITEKIIASVAPLGEEYQSKMRQVFTDRWIDVYENEGKTSGAYSAGVYGVHPYLLLNYNGTLDNVFTVAHEVGHCMHTQLSYESQPFATADYTIFVAEVASTLNEALFLEYMMERTSDPKERVALLQHAIENILGTFYTQVMFADFEWQAHKMVEEGKPITADVLRQLYFSLLTEYYGDAVELDDYYGSTWTRISHFYGSPYYVYKYATCFASSAELVQEITSEDDAVRKAALKRYLNLLRSGGNDYPMNQLQAAGVDLTKPQTVQAVVNQLDDLVTRFEQELERI
ncbi:oligoendopeptidase F [candidate division GN15 bacterium]|nr:oligoendopeptidase F [candidate division GN15 bacterium]